MEKDSEDKPLSGLKFVNLHRDDQSPRVDIRIRKSKDYIYFGKNNLFPQKLIELADNSAIQNSLLQATATLIAGEGLIFEGSGEEEFNELLKGVSVKDYLWKKGVDLAYFDGFYDNVIWNRGGKIDKVAHKDFSSVRVSKELKDDRPEAFFISADWKVATKKTIFTEDDKIFEPIEIPAFDPKTFKSAESRKHGQVLQARRYKPSKLFYAEPAYMGALNYIEISGRIGDFHVNGLRNGMVGNMHIHLFEDLSDVEKELRVEREINKKFAGSENSQRIVLTWSRTKDAKPELESLPTNDTHEMFTFLNRKVNEEIITAHRFQPILAGIEVDTGLGGKGLALRESIEILQNTVINPKQMMIEDTINHYLEINDIQGVVKIKPISFVKFLAESAILLKTMHIDEIRKELLGLEEIEGGNAFAQAGRITQ